MRSETNERRGFHKLRPQLLQIQTLKGVVTFGDKILVLYI